MATGTIKWFNDEKGYGFIKPDDPRSKDVFVHYSGIKRTGGQRVALNEGDKVEFEEVDSEKGKKAINVSRVGSAVSADMMDREPMDSGY